MSKTQCWEFMKCGRETGGTFAEKAMSCLSCQFLQNVKDEERDAFRFLVTGREFEEVSSLISTFRELTARQEMTIRELSMPVLQIWEGILLTPLIGVIDSRQAVDVMERVLNSVASSNSRYVILDLTGVEIVDTKTADHLIKIVQASEILGARCVLTGIQPAVAQTLVEIGVDLRGLRTVRNLEAGLRLCLREIRAGAA
ncbi:MAG: STAS domain-containing protein [Candidatus Riflebacteria bacterium]|nr:STAS domain-containing protein [Candidatus Riflebacteria bacterium]